MKRMAQPSANEIERLRKIGAFKPGGRKLLKKEGYTADEAESIFFTNAPEPRVFGRRSQGIDSTRYKQEKEFKAQLAAGQRASPTNQFMSRSPGPTIGPRGAIGSRSGGGYIYPEYRSIAPPKPFSSAKDFSSSRTDSRFKGSLKDNKILKFLGSIPRLSDLSKKANDQFKMINNRAINDLYSTKKVSWSTRSAAGRFMQKYGVNPLSFMKVTNRFRAGGSEAGTQATNFIRSFYDVPQLFVALASSKQNRKDFIASVKNMPMRFKQDAMDFGELIRISPETAIIKVVGNYLMFKGTGKGLKYVGEASEQAVAKSGLAGKFLGEAKTGSKVNIPSRSGRTITLKVSGSIPRESLGSQVGRAGTRVNAISSQADKLVSLLKQKRIVRKPIPGEDKFDSFTRGLLNRFDSGKITRKEFIKLQNILVRKYRTKGILERSFFADPTGQIRPSRLGIRKEQPMGFIDSMVEDITFRKKQPQILFFENVQVQNFPRSLRQVAMKLRRGQALTKAEGDALLRFQLTKSRKFKPVGFISKESEITLAPGEVIKKGRRIGVQIVNGRKVPLVRAEIYRPRGRTRQLLVRLEKNRISKGEIAELDKRLRKETGFDYNVSSRYAKTGGRYVSLSQLSLNAASRGVKYLSKSGQSYRYLGKSPVSGRSGLPGRLSRGMSRPGRGSPPRYPGSPGKGGSGMRSPVGTSRPGLSPPRGPPGSPGSKIPGRLQPGKRGSLQQMKGRAMGYNVWGKSKGRLIRLNKMPLSWRDAQSRGAYAIDNTTSKTFIVRPAGHVNQLGQIKKWERGYINRSRSKFRSYKVRRGRAVQFSAQRSIEKRRYGIDTRGEKKQLSLSRFIKSGRIAPRGKIMQKPKYRYVSNGVFGGTRRILVQPRVSRRKVLIRSVAKKGTRPKRRRYYDRGIFG